MDGMQIDPMLFRKTLGHFASGVAVVTTVHEGTVHGMTANAFSSVSLHPPLVLISMDNRTRMHALLQQTRRYGVSILTRNQEPLSRHFGGRPQQELEVPFSWQRDCPLIEEAVAQLVCRVIDIHPAGDHTLYIGQVEYLDCSDSDAPLLFYSGKYRTLDVQITDYTVVNDPSWW
jgi:flavin reductase (DIM6/NTAB) family NADH-FMN oxidoreductase RutF